MPPPAPSFRSTAPVIGGSSRAEAKLALSPRGFVRVLKVARTIADLAGREAVSLRRRGGSAAV
ncbi:MAG: hypothetical protein U0514_03230 [Candidatus Andersenbacteria bacterium]